MLQKRLNQLKTSAVAQGMRCETVLTADLKESRSERTGILLGGRFH